MTDQDRPAMGETQGGKPRICEVLGVDIDQPFNINYPCRAYNCLVVRPDGKVWETGPYPHKIGSNALYYLIEHKDEIIHKPRFTEEEVAFIKRIPAKYMSRDLISNGEGSVDFWSEKPIKRGGVFVGQRVAMVPICFVPSLRPGQSVALREIVDSKNAPT